MKPQTSPTSPPTVDRTALSSGEQFTYFFLVQSPDDAVRARVLRRLELEFGLRAFAPAKRDLEASPSAVFVAIDAPTDGDRLVGFQQHADRVSKLFADSCLNVRAGHATPCKITLAQPSDAPGRMHLRAGIWGAILGERNSSESPWRWTSESHAIASQDAIEHFTTMLLDSEVRS